MAQFGSVNAVLLILVITYTVSVNATSPLPISLKKSSEGKSHVNILVTVQGHQGGIEQVLNDVLQKISTDASRGEKITAIYDALNSHAAETQKPIVEFLNSNPQIKYQSFWITNQIYIQGADQEFLEALSRIDGIKKITEERIVKLSDVMAQESLLSRSTSEAVFAHWGVGAIQTEEAWEVGGKGTGVIVGIIDTGARWTHEALRDSFEGGAKAWFNPYNHTQLPEDDNGHGTHVTGTVAGGMEGIGVAPGAKWIACKGWVYDEGWGTEAGLLACGQFMVCPHTYNGSNPDCSRAPHVINNSWMWDWTPGGYDDVIRTWHAAGIIPVFAQGNDGPSCGTAMDPGDSVAGVIGVGSVREGDLISTSSSRGPGRTGNLKPDITAPGHNIWSAGYRYDSDYTYNAGTSMACPHVAGVVALLKGMNADLTYSQIKSIIEGSAERNLTSSGQICNGLSDTEFPNYTFGYGRLNALNAVRAAEQLI